MILDELSVRLRNTVVHRLGVELGTQDEATTESRVRSLLEDALAQERALISADERVALCQDIVDDVLGYGPITRYLRDPSVSEIMVNGADTIYVERSGKIYRTDEKFLDDKQLRRVVDKIVRTTGRRVDESNPMVDARLPDGSRVNVVIPPLALEGPVVTIRKFTMGALSGADLVRLGTATDRAMEFLQQCVMGKMNIIVSGGTGAGKTTTLNVLSSFIPTDERIVTIEDVSELQLAKDHLIRLEARPANVEGQGEVTIRSLLRNALRMRPDRIVIGEARGGEALDLLQAMNTGHDGSLSTIHANSPRDAISRLETMVLMAGMDLPMKAIRSQLASAVDLVIQQARITDGTRRITHVTEVDRLEGEVVSMQDIFTFDFTAGTDEDGRHRGRLKATGVRPRFADKLLKNGVVLGPDLFAFEAPEGRVNEEFSLA